MSKINIISLGKTACNIAKEFEQYKIYDIYYIGNDVDNSKKKYKLKKYKEREDYEKNAPDLKYFLRNIGREEKIFFIVNGASISSNSALVILQQIKYCENINIVYIKPELELLNESIKKQEKLIYNVLQEYTRSGIFQKIFIFSNELSEKISGEDLNLKNYYSKINQLISWAIHTYNIFQNIDPVAENFLYEDPKEINRIATFGILDVETFEERYFYDLGEIKEKKYYYAISKENINDSEIFKKIKNKLKEKKLLTDSVTYGIYEVEFDNIALCLSLSSKIQK